MSISTEFVTLAVDDGTSMRAYVARPEEKPKAGLVVFQEIFGVNSHIRDVTERFGREGYLAIAPELFHRTGPGFESGYTDMALGRTHAQATTDEGLAADIRAAFDWLQEQGEGKKLPSGAVGYCMGGRVATLASMTAPFKCSISYYGGGIAPHPFYKVNLLERFGEIQCPMLFFWGGKDQFITPESVHAVTSKLRALNKTFVSVEFSEADHGFFCDQRGTYNAEASAEAWALTLAYLADHSK
jgi:carboxymethylenebutenolidase